MLKNIQQQFLGQILGHKNKDITPLIEDHGLITKKDRIHIYTSAYSIRLKQCIESDHPVLGVYLGDELFDLMVDEYIKSYPSQNTSLRYYADNLIKLLSEKKPFKDHPVIAELAHFERALLSAFDAAETKTSSVDDLSLVPIDSWPTLKFIIHPSVKIFIAQNNAVEIWQAIKQKAQIPDAINTNINYWLIWRNPERLTEFKSITANEKKIIKYMINGDDFSIICEKMAKLYNESEIEQAILSHLLSLIQSNILQLEH